METEPVEEQGYIGSYQLSVIPDRFRTALICVHDIVAAGHLLCHLQPTQHHHLRQQRCLYTPRTPGPHLQRMARATYCARTTNATTFNAPNPPTATYPNRDAPQLTAGQHIQERTTTRTRTKHRYPRRSPPRPHPEDQLCLAVNTTWRNTGVTPSDIRRVFYRQPCLVCVLAKHNKDRN